MLHRLKTYVPANWLNVYHVMLAHLAAFTYGYPSRKLIVIGVTGTNGKTTTAYLLARALEACGERVGCTSTAVLKIADREWINDTKMTMPGRFFLQRMLRRMVQAGCRYAVIETSSQGLVQHRHAGIAYDVAVFTNLTPEHIEAHGGFEAYQRAKRLLFEHVATRPQKIVHGKIVPRLAVVNADSPYGEYYGGVSGFDQVTRYSIQAPSDVQAQEAHWSDRGAQFRVKGQSVELQLPGVYNIENTLAALATVQSLGCDVGKAIKGVEAVTLVPGRFERVDVGQTWTVIVDYAPDPESLRRLYEVVTVMPHARLIHVLGSCGGGRDLARRPILGRMAGRVADVVIVTNEDPYDDDPRVIMDQVAAGAREVGKRDGENLFEIEDRREAIFMAMNYAQPGDVVLMTGKGAEAWMCLAEGKKLSWNEVETAKQAIQAALKKHDESPVMKK